MHYFSKKNNRKIDLNIDVCSLDQWSKDNSKFLCCRHPNNFLIFLDPDEINVSDEYANDDPYSVIDNINSSMHQRRFKCTTDLVGDNKENQHVKLLDLGCGQGHLTNYIKEKFKDFEVHGLDYSVSAIDYASTHFKNIDFIVANAYQPPFENEYFDIVVCNNIWEHVPDPVNLLKSISRILKSNGVLIISTPSRYRLMNLLKIFKGKKISFMSKSHVTEYTVGQVKELLQFGGFQVSKVYSPKIKEKKLILRLLKPSIYFFFKITKSHHILEATVFYSAIKKVS